jgi:hypothetical protein
LLLGEGDDVAGAVADVRRRRARALLQRGWSGDLALALADCAFAMRHAGALEAAQGPGAGTETEMLRIRVSDPLAWRDSLDAR